MGQIGSGQKNPQIRVWTKGLAHETLLRTVPFRHGIMNRLN